MKIAACYIRVSTAEQTEYSPESQLRMIKDYAAKNDIALPERYIYRDEGISGRNAEKRPAFQNMISAAKQKSFKVILIYSTSRFARNHEQSIAYRSMLEKECSIEVISITQPTIDKKTDMLTTAIYSIMDEWYSMDLADNVRRGMKEKALRGEYQANTPFGYQLEQKGGIMIIQENEAETVRYIFDQFKNGKSRWAIARDLTNKGVKTKKGCSMTTRSITYILRNPAYKGYSRWTPTKRVYWDFSNKDTIITKSRHEAIIDEQKFDEVQVILNEAEKITKANARPKEGMKHWLSGLIKCSKCNQSLVYTSSSPRRKNPCFRCGGYGRGTCDYMNFITVAETEANVLSYLQKIMTDINTLYVSNILSGSHNQEQVNILHSEISKTNAKAERAKQGFLNGIFQMDEYKQIKQSCENEILKINGKIHKLEKNESVSKPLQRSIRNIFEILVSERFATYEKQNAIRSIIHKIIFDKKNREFRIYFYQ